MGYGLVVKGPWVQSLVPKVGLGGSNVFSTLSLCFCIVMTEQWKIWERQLHIEHLWDFSLRTLNGEWRVEKYRRESVRQR